MKPLHIPLLTVILITLSLTGTVFARGGGFSGGTGGGGRGPTATTRSGDPTTPEGFEQKISELQDQMRQLVDRAGVTQTSVNEMYNSLTNELDRAQLTLRAKAVREQAIQAKIVELTSQARQKIDDDNTLKQLTATADLRQKDAERTRQLHEQKLVSKEELDRRIADAADAVVRVEERREAITANVGGGALSALNKELIAVSLDLREQEAIVQLLESRRRIWQEARVLYQELNRLNSIRSDMLLAERLERSRGGGGARGLEPRPAASMPSRFE